MMIARVDNARFHDIATRSRGNPENGIPTREIIVNWELGG